MKEPIYLDNSATTPLCSPAIDRMNEVMRCLYGNPSSLHGAGLEAERVITQAKFEILSCLGVREPSTKQLVFCGSGTEASNLAIFGTAYAKTYKFKPRIITTDSEHPSVEEPLRKLEGCGFEVVRIPTEGGRIDTASLDTALTPEVILVTMMLVNNETGALYDIAGAFSKVKELCPDAVTHCDAVQGFMKLRFSPQSLNADLVTISAHKIGGPKGAGALFINPRILTAKKIVPVILGGGQENGLRSGTENTVAIAGFGAAAKHSFEHLCDNMKTAGELRGLLLKIIAENPALREIKTKEPYEYIPNIINITLPGIKSETMLHYLSGRGIYISSGSACSSHLKHPSRALLSFGISKQEADSSLRISLSHANTEAEITEFANALADGVSSLIRIRHR